MDFMPVVKLPVPLSMVQTDWELTLSLTLLSLAEPVPTPSLKKTNLERPLVE